MESLRVKIPLNIWGPWTNNPSKPENFYKTNEEIEEVKEEKTEEINEQTKNLTLSNNIDDPYSDILKDLK